MRIIDAKWTPAVNKLRIFCDRGHRFWHRSDRWKIVCPSCSLESSLGRLRAIFRKDGGFATCAIWTFTTPNPPPWIRKVK